MKCQHAVVGPGGQPRHKPSSELPPHPCLMLTCMASLKSLTSATFSLSTKARPPPVNVLWPYSSFSASVILLLPSRTRFVQCPKRHWGGGDCDNWVMCVLPEGNMVGLPPVNCCHSGRQAQQSPTTGSLKRNSILNSIHRPQICIILHWPRKTCL